MIIYLKECEPQLGNESFYEEVKKDPLQGIMQKICKTLLDMLIKKEIDKKLFNYLFIRQ